MSFGSSDSRPSYFKPLSYQVQGLRSILRRLLLYFLSSRVDLGVCPFISPCQSPLPSWPLLNLPPWAFHTLRFSAAVGPQLEYSVDTSCGCYWFLKFIYLFLKFYFIFKLYNIVLVLPDIEMNLPQVYLCSPSWTLLPPPSPYPPSGSSQCTSPKHPVFLIEGCLLYNIMLLAIHQHESAIGTHMSPPYVLFLLKTCVNIDPIWPNWNGYFIIDCICVTFLKEAIIPAYIHFKIITSA